MEQMMPEIQPEKLNQLPIFKKLEQTELEQLSKEELQQHVRQLEERIIQYQEDRFCPGGCMAYQYGKLSKFRQFFKDILDDANIVESFLCAFGVSSKRGVISALEDIKEQCEAAISGDLW